MLPKGAVGLAGGRKWFVPAALIALAVAWLLYHPALGFSFVNYDDHFYVRDNPRLAEGLTWESWKWAWTANFITPDRRAEYWMPLTLLSRLLDVQLFGEDGGWHHAQSLFWHAVNAWLVFVLFVRTSGAAGRSAAIALLWLVHPLNVETVAWVALRKDVLAGTFSLLTLLAWVRCVHQRSLGAYGLALLMFFGAILCKPSVVALPALLLVLDWWPLQRPEWTAGQGMARLRGWARLLAEKIPFVALAAWAAWLTYATQQDLESGGGRLDYRWIDRVRQVLAGYDGYVQKAMLPDQLCVLYPLRSPAEIPTEAVWHGAVLLAVLTAAFAWLAGRGRRAYAAGWVWFLAVLLPVSGLVPFGRQAMADRYAYLALVGFAAGAVWLAADVIEAMTARWTSQLRLLTAGGAVVAVAAALSSRIGLSWEHGATTIRCGVKCSPRSVTARWRLTISARRSARIIWIEWPAPTCWRRTGSIPATSSTLAISGSSTRNAATRCSARGCSIARCVPSHLT